MFPLIRDLPTKYHRITEIPSVELKLKLAERISVILKLLKFFDSIVIQDDLAKKLQTYFTYLNTSCDNSELIRKRATWLLNYSEIIQHLLLKARFGSLLNQETSSLTNHHYLLVDINKLTDQFRVYVIRSEQSLSDVNLIITLLSDVTDLFYLAHPKAENIGYYQISQLLQETTSFVTAWNKCGVMSDNGHLFIFSQLKTIKYRCVDILLMEHFNHGTH